VTSNHYDVAIVGAGPNGLTAAAYLARAGAKVIVFEQRFERGGTLASDDYSTPFLYNQAQFLLPLGGAELPPYRDLALEEYAVAFIEPKLAFAVSVDGEPLFVERHGRGLGDELVVLLAEASTLAPRLWYLPASKAAALARASALANETPRTASAMAGDDRAALIVRYACGLVGARDPDQPLGTIRACALARTFEPVLVAGGSKSLANGLFRAAARAGALCLVSTCVTAIDPPEVRLADGRRFTARTVISTPGPKTTLRPFTAHFGVKGVVAPARPEDGTDAAVRVLGFASAEEVTSHFQAAAAGRVPDRPAGHVTITTHHDPLQASPGPYGPLNTVRMETRAPHGEDWDRLRIPYRERCWELACSEIEGLDAVLPLFSFADSPPDLERRFANTRYGSLPHAAEQHAAVPGTLAGGYHAAAAVCAELGLERWWPEASF